MRRFRCVLFFFMLTLVTLHAQTLKFSAEAPGAVLAGEKFQLSYVVNDEASDLRVPPLETFEILMGPSTSQSSSVSIINGKMERSVEYRYTYILKARQPGKYNIAPATIVVNGKKYESNPLTIDVIKGDDASGNSGNQKSSNEDVSGVSDEDIIVTVSANKNEAYKDEAIVLTTKIYVRQVNLQGFSDYKPGDLKDFVTQELPNSGNIEWSIVNLNGKTYNVGTYEQKLLFPQKTGRLTISPTEFECLIKQRVARRSQSVFDDFFESNYRTVKKRIYSKPVTIHVKPLPSNAPSDFSGIVGNVKMGMSISRNDIKANDGVTLKLEISGTGNHKLMSNPEINIPVDFDKFDPKITNNISTTVAGMTGTKIFEYLIIPRHSGTYTIPPITLSYFDPDAGMFKQLTTNSIPIKVEKGTIEETTLSTAQYNASREELKFIGKDIRYIKTGFSQLKPRGTFLFGSLLFYSVYLLAILAFVVFYVLIQKRINDNSNSAAVKNRRASKIAHKRLQTAHALLKKNDKEAFYDEVLKALWGYMSDKLTLPLAKLSKENASALMKNFEVPDETIEKFMEILNTCEFARYAPSSGSAEMDKLYQDTIETITLLEGQIKK